MTNISKRPLPEKDLAKLFDQLHTVISKLNKQTSHDFFDDLLGAEEKIMLVKRLAAVVMFIEGNSSYRVWQLLKMSPTTAERIKKDYSEGRYYNLELIVTKNKKAYTELWAVLEIILSAGLPPRGRGRWKSVFNQA